MESEFLKFRDTVQRLHATLESLQRAVAGLEVAPLRGRDWYELLVRKLVPQLSDEAYLVVAVVGGTNIGKSVIFNHIAGCRASATSPLASGTKHPTCLVPASFTERHNLAEVFPGFELQEWSDADAALAEDDRHLLFWRRSEETPDNLLVLDTPDIDSDARINWERADHIRQCADVLIAVLTQQKYNDAAVKEFFRKAAAEEKLIAVVFNQCLLPDDEPYWPLWVSTFCDETGVDPEILYVAPNDRPAAEALKLPFYERPWPVDGAAPPANDQPRSLLADLSQLKFHDIKLQTLSGSLRHLTSEDAGIPTWLREIEQCSERYRAASELLAAHELARINDWPVVPDSVMIAEIRSWWQTQRTGWSATVHNVYNAIGKGVTWPVHFARDRLYGESVPPLERYREREWNTILTTVEKVYEKLTWLEELGNELLRPRLKKLLSGTSRAELLQQIHAEHQQVDLAAELEQLVSRELTEFQRQSPKHFEFFKRIDTIAAAARPATSVVLFVAGFGPAGNAIAPALTDAAVQGALHIAGDFAGGTVAVAVGEGVMSGAAAGAGWLEARFRRLHEAFTAERAAWLATLLKRHLLGDLPEELQAAASLTGRDEFRDVTAAVARLREQIEQIPATLETT